MKTCILISDDDVDILDVCKIILEQQNYRVETRTRCENIIEDISLAKPDIILMDLWIPEIGGESAVNLMKNNEATQHVPVILFSANAEIADIANRTNANAYLSKPFDVIALKKIIEENMGMYAQ